MISYKRLWETMKSQGMTYYKLEKHYRIATGTLRNLQNDQPVSIATLNKLCMILNCSLTDIVEYIEDPEEYQQFLEEVRIRRSL